MKLFLIGAEKKLSENLLKLIKSINLYLNSIKSKKISTNIATLIQIKNLNAAREDILMESRGPRSKSS